MAVAPAPPAKSTFAGAPDTDAATRQRADAFAEQAGLRLPPELQAQLYAAAPYAFAMAARMRRGFAGAEEPSNVFRHEYGGTGNQS